MVVATVKQRRRGDMRCRHDAGLLKSGGRKCLPLPCIHYSWWDYNLCFVSVKSDHQRRKWSALAVHWRSILAHSTVERDFQITVKDIYLCLFVKKGSLVIICKVMRKWQWTYLNQLNDGGAHLLSIVAFFTLDDQFVDLWRDERLNWPTCVPGEIWSLYLAIVDRSK